MCETKKKPQARFGEPDDCHMLRQQYAREIERARKAGEVLAARRRELAMAEFERQRAERNQRDDRLRLSDVMPGPRVDRPWYLNRQPHARVFEGLRDAWRDYSEGFFDEEVERAERAVRQASRAFNTPKRRAEAVAKRLDRLGCAYTDVDILLRNYL